MLARSFPRLGWIELEVPSGDPLAAGRRLLNDGRVFRLDHHWKAANFFAAWDTSRGSSAVKIAVVDSEFDTEHPDLKNKFTTGYNAERRTGPCRSSNVRASDQQVQEAIANPDNNSLHGTHVSGLVAAPGFQILST